MAKNYGIQGLNQGGIPWESEAKVQVAVALWAESSTLVVDIAAPFG
jgi:hypothetical protein